MRGKGSRRCPPAAAGAAAGAEEERGGEAGRDSAAVLEELRAIYRKHVPEKTREDVEAILAKYKGREAGLLVKVRAKYVP